MPGIQTGKTQVMITGSPTKVKYLIIQDMGGSYYRLKNGDKELIDHIDNLKIVKRANRKS